MTRPIRDLADLKLGQQGYTVYQPHTLESVFIITLHVSAVLCQREVSAAFCGVLIVDRVYRSGQTLGIQTRHTITY